MEVKWCTLIIVIPITKVDNSLYRKRSFEMTNMEKGVHGLKRTEDQQPNTIVAVDLVSYTILQDT